MASRALTALLFMPLMVNALEKLDDTSMSDVVAQEGVRLISEYELYIQNIALIDTDDGGKTTLSDINFSTRPNRRQEIDFKIASKTELYEGYGGDCIANPAACNDELGLAFFNRDLPFDLEVGAVEINGKSVGKVGITNFEVDAFSQYAHNAAFLAPLTADERSLNVTAFAGGSDGRGINFSIYMPKTAQFDQYFESDGVKLASTVRFIDADPKNTNLATINQDGESVPTTIDDYAGGLDLANITVDVVDDGLLLGLPTMDNGLIAITDLRIGNDDIGYDFINDIIFKDIKLTGGSILLKPDEVAGHSSLNMDIVVNKDTGFTFVYRDDLDQINARISLEENLEITGASINTHADRGLEIGLGQIKGRILIDNITLSPNSLTSAQRQTQAPLGELTMNLNIANTSYINIRGI